MRSSGDARSCSYTLATLLESRASAGRSISRRGVVRTGVGPPATMMRAGLHFASHYRPNAHLTESRLRLRSLRGARTRRVTRSPRARQEAGRKDDRMKSDVGEATLQVA